MPTDPSPAQAEASRRNGARSTGPVTPEGRARAARNAVRHGLRGGPFALLPGEDAAAFEALRADLEGRHAPRGPTERHWVEELAFAAWRQRRLRALEAAVLAAEEDGTDEPETHDLPSLATLARYRARLERDWRLAEAALERLKADRPRLPVLAGRVTAERLRWLAARAEESGAANANANVAGGTPEPEPPNRHERRRLAALERQAARGRQAGPVGVNSL